MLNAKLMYCKEQDIPAVISVDKNIRGLTQTELCCVLGNLLDNAIEAELKLSKAQRKIEIKIVMIEEVLDILIRNCIAEPVLQDVQKVKNIGVKLIQRQISCVDNGYIKHDPSKTARSYYGTYL